MFIEIVKSLQVISFAGSSEAAFRHRPDLS